MRREAKLEQQIDQRLGILKEGLRRAQNDAGLARSLRKDEARIQQTRKPPSSWIAIIIFFLTTSGFKPRTTTVWRR